jgi:hypothetical protein
VLWLNIRWPITVMALTFEACAVAHSSPPELRAFTDHLQNFQP